MFLQELLNDLPIMLLTLPAILISLSVHEASHGFVANKLGDPTAANLGRLTLNPLKHINLIGFLSMLFFRVGWANPVPINTRYFKKPKRDMALTALAGPLSNLCLAIIFTILLRLVMIPTVHIMNQSMTGAYISEDIFSNPMFILLSLLAIMLFLGISLNLNLMFFNLIPLPPLDGSRIAYIFLPSNIYFKVMQYERYIMIGFIFLLVSGIIDLPLTTLTSGVTEFLYKITGMPENYLYFAISNLLSRLPTFSL